MNDRVKPDALSFQQMPAMQNPYLIATWKGWGDAAQAASGAAQHLRKKLAFEKLAEIRSEEFYASYLERPRVTTENGVIKHLVFPLNEFYFGTISGGEPQIILFIGTEPHLNWNEYIECIMYVVKQYNVRQVYVLGSYLAGIPHTVVPRLSMVTTTTELRDKLMTYGIDPISYEGPTGIHSMLTVECEKQGVDVAALWSPAPYYVQGIPNPKVSYAILTGLLKCLQTDLDLSDLKAASEYLDDSLNRHIGQKPELAALVKKLEETYDETQIDRQEEPLATDEIVMSVEEFLRKQQEEDSSQ